MNDVQSYIFFVYIFFVERFFYCLLLLLSFSSLIRSMVLRLFETFIWLSVSLCLFNIQSNIDVYNGNISSFLSMYLQFSFFFCFARNSNWTHLCVLAEENHIFDHLPRSTLNECHIHSIVYICCVLIENITIYRIYFKPSK